MFSPKTAVLAGLGAAIIHGAPITQRVLGHGSEPESEPPALDPAWSFRDASPREFTRDPIRQKPAPGYTPPEEPMATWPSVSSAAGPNENYDVDVLVVGGAAAGCSVGACLQRRGVTNYVIIEKNDRPGDIWRSRYTRLHLHDIAAECELPYFALPKDFPVYGTRRQFAQYVDAYALALGLKLRTRSAVRMVERVGDHFEVSVESVESKQVYKYRAKHVAFCNSVYNDPIIPSRHEGADQFPGLQLHSSRYTNGTDLNLKGKRVLVVGFGNSACEIAVDLVEHGAHPTILARSVQTVVPRWFFQRMQEALHSHVLPLLKLPFGWLPVLGGLAVVDPLAYLVQLKEFGTHQSMLQDYGFPVDWKGPITRMVTTLGPPVMDVGTFSLARQGKLKVIPFAEVAKMESDGTVHFRNTADAEPTRAQPAPEKFDAVIWATGFELLEGHKHFLSPELFKEFGAGKDSFLQHGLQPGSQHPVVKGLWINYGRLQMLSQGAEKLAWGLAQELGVTSPNDAIDAKDSWGMYAAKHGLVAAVGYLAYTRYRAPKAKL